MVHPITDFFQRLLLFPRLIVVRFFSSPLKHGREVVLLLFTLDLLGNLVVALRPSLVSHLGCLSMLVTEVNGGF